MFSILDPKVKAAEIHRSTPFEFAVTAEPQRLVQKCAQPVQFASPQTSEVVVVKLIRRRPEWIASILARTRLSGPLTRPLD